MKNIVIIGGGTGTFTLLSGLRKYPSNNTVIVSSADDGGSTGALRKELGVFPPGDLRQCLVGLSYTQSELQDLFNLRFDKGSLAGHTAGNIIIAALEKITGNVETAVELAAKMLNVRGQVLPVTLKSTTLSAIYDNGKKVVGEHNIDEPNKKIESRIKSLVLNPSLRANPKVIEAIKSADAIVFGPGDLYTSIIPNLLVGGVKDAIKKSKAQKMVVTSIMTKPGQTTGFTAGDFSVELNKYLGVPVDVAVVNTGKPKADALKLYKKSGADVVVADVKAIEKSGTRVIAENLISSTVFKQSSGDKLKRSVLRHDCDKVAKIIYQLI